MAESTTPADNSPVSLDFIPIIGMSAEEEDMLTMYATLAQEALTEITSSLAVPSSMINGTGGSLAGLHEEYRKHFELTLRQRLFRSPRGSTVKVTNLTCGSEP